MENRVGWYVLGTVVVVAVALVVAFLVFRQPKHNWQETLTTATEGPYDLTVFKTLLDSSTTAQFVTTDKAVTEWIDTVENSNYIFVGRQPFYDSTEAAAILNFIKRGNTVFIASRRWPQTFFDAAWDEKVYIGGEDWVYSKTVFPTVHANGKKHQYDFEGPEGNDEKWWGYINLNPDDDEDEEDPELEEVDPAQQAVEEFFDDSEFESEESDEEFEEEEMLVEDSLETEEILVDSLALQEIDSLNHIPTDTFVDEWVRMEVLGHFVKGSTDSVFPNFLAVDIGKGRLYMHTNPIMFSNFFLIKEDGFEYTNEVLELLEDRDTYWEEYHQSYHYTFEDDYYEARTPLRFIFQHAPLKYAWFTLVGAAFLFMIFRSKREQKPIPIIPAVENTSIEFAKSLGVLYHQSTNGRFLAVELMRMFDNFNRRHYRIHRNRKDQNSGEEIAKRSRADRALIDEILKLELKTVYNPLSKIQEVVTLYDRLEEYYKQAKK